jgi:superfamily I DNA and/or RNA helicase
LSPDAASSLIPLQKNEFDIGIFDEASQVTIERSYSLIYRCKSSVISGDDKQLKPSAFFSKSVEIDESYDDDLENVNSLLDKAKSSN